MQIIDLPRTPVAAKIDWKPHQPTQINRSEFTRDARATILGGGSYWSAGVSYPTIMGEAAFRPWRSALLRVRGRANGFRLLASEGPQHRVAQHVVIDGAGQQGYALATRGWQPGTGLRDGMFITVVTATGVERLLTVVGNTPLAGADGRLALAVEPLLPAGLTDGAPVETLLPWATMRMATDEQGWTVDRGQQYAVAFDCEEA